MENTLPIEYAEYHELKERGIKHSINHGKNDFGFINRTIICNDGTQWDYMPEDQLYEQRLENLYAID